METSPPRHTLYCRCQILRTVKTLATHAMTEKLLGAGGWGKEIQSVKEIH